MIESLDWYALLKAPRQADLGRTTQKAKRERSLQASDVQVIWYSDGGAGDPHRALPEVTQRLRRESGSPTVTEQRPGLVETMLDAEALATVTSPNPSDLRKAEGYLTGHPRVAEAFMDQVDGLVWFRHLCNLGALTPQQSIRSPDGTRSAPYWHAADFLERVARVAPREVKDFLLTIETDNWVAIHRSLKVLEALDDPNGAAFGAALANQAVNALPDDPWLAVALAESARNLALAGKHGAASALVETALIAIATANPGSLQATRMITPDVVSVLKQSVSGLGVAAAALRRVLEQEYGDPASDTTRYVRSSIDVHETQTGLHDDSTLGLLIDLVRDTLQTTDDDAERARVVETLLHSNWPTERRIGVAHGFLRPSDLPTHEAAAITTENLSNPHLFHELAKLVVDHAQDLSDESVRKLKRFAADLYADPSEARQRDYEWWARVIPGDWLPVPSEPDLDREDDPDRRLFRDFFVSDAVWGTAPLDEEGFTERAAELTPDELLHLVRDPAAAGVTLTWDNDASLMWDRLAEYAKKRDLLAPLLHIRASDLGGDNGSWRAIEAMAAVAGDSADRWSNVLNWADSMVPEASDNIYWSLGLLLVEAGSTVPLALGDHLRRLALQVIARTRRVTADESEFVERSMLGGFLNHPAGKATQPLFELLRREVIEHQEVGSSSTELPAWFEETVARSPIARPTEPRHRRVDRAWSILRASVRSLSRIGRVRRRASRI